MQRKQLGDTGRVARVKPAIFRLSVEERAKLDADAKAAGLRPNELARRRTLGYGDAADLREIRVFTDSTADDGEMSTDSILKELRVEYDE